MTVNSDDPAYFVAYLTENLETVATGGSQPDRARAAREERVRDFVAADGSERRPPRRVNNYAQNA